MNHIIEFRNPIQKAARESVQSKKCAFTGHRPQSLPFGFDESDERCIALKSAMQERIVALIENEVLHILLLAWLSELICLLRRLFLI